MADELKPCPFCAGKARRAQVLPGPGERFGCTACAIDAYTAEDWNRRTPGPATRAMIEAVLEELREFPDSDVIAASREVLAAFLAEWSEPTTPPRMVSETDDEASQAIDRLAEAIEDAIPEWPNYIEAERKEGWRVYTRIGNTLLCSDFFGEPSEAVLDLEERASQLLADKTHKPFNPAPPPAPEQPTPSSPWKCCICHALVRIADDLRPYHVAGPGNHEAELSDEDRKILADGLRLTD